MVKDIVVELVFMLLETMRTVVVAVEQAKLVQMVDLVMVAMVYNLVLPVMLLTTLAAVLGAALVKVQAETVAEEVPESTGLQTQAEVVVVRMLVQQEDLVVLA